MKQHSHGQEQYVEIANADKALTVFTDERGYIRHKEQPFMVFDGWGEYQNRGLILFTMIPDYDNQAFTINKDGTISMDRASDYVLGTDAAAKEVLFVRKGNPGQLVFAEVEDYL